MSNRDENGVYPDRFEKWSKARFGAEDPRPSEEVASIFKVMDAGAALYRDEKRQEAIATDVTKARAKYAGYTPDKLVQEFCEIDFPPWAPALFAESCLKASREEMEKLTVSIGFRLAHYGCSGVVEQLLGLGVIAACFDPLCAEEIMFALRNHSEYPSRLETLETLVENPGGSLATAVMGAMLDEPLPGREESWSRVLSRLGGTGLSVAPLAVKADPAMVLAAAAKSGIEPALAEAHPRMKELIDFEKNAAEELALAAKPSRAAMVKKILIEQRLDDAEQAVGMFGARALFFASKEQRSEPAVILSAAERSGIERALGGADADFVGKFDLTAANGKLKLAALLSNGQCVSLVDKALHVFGNMVFGDKIEMIEKAKIRKGHEKP